MNINNGKNFNKFIEEMVTLPSMIGFDKEHCYSIQGRPLSDTETAPLILKEIEGFRSNEFTTYGLSYYGYGNSETASCRDWYRTWLTNGGCVYIDLAKVECCSPCCSSAKEILAYYEAFRRILNEARQKAEESSDKKLIGFDSVSDRQIENPNFWGNHLNTLIPQIIWDRILDNSHAHSGYMVTRLYIPFVAVSVLIGGAGKVKREGNRNVLVLGDRYEALECPNPSENTVSQRPVMNSRKEPLCSKPYKTKSGLEIELGRLHNIPFDSLRAETANFALIGMLQIFNNFLIAASLGIYPVPDFELSNPISAIRIIGEDINLKKDVKLSSGKYLTGLELFEEIYMLLQRYIWWFERQLGNFSRVVPEHKEIMEVTGELLRDLKNISRQKDKDIMPLVGKLDWANKQYILTSFFSNRSSSWQGAKFSDAALLDLFYHNIDPQNSLFHKCIVENGFGKRVISDRDVEYALSNPPPTSRDWFRGIALKKFGGEFSDIDWDKLEKRESWYNSRIIKLGHPLSFTRAEVGNLSKISNADELFDFFEEKESFTFKNLYT